MSAIARELDVSFESLRAWVRREEVGPGLQEGLSIPDGEELARLRRENRILREEREILKKAAAFFAKETDRNR
jgi:transposase